MNQDGESKAKVIPKILDTIGGPYLELRMDNGHQIAVNVDAILAVGDNELGRGHVYLDGMQLATIHDREEILEGLRMKTMEELLSEAGEAVKTSALDGIARKI